MFCSCILHVKLTSLALLLQSYPKRDRHFEGMDSQPIQPMSAEDVFKNIPPPSYEEIMGHQTLTSAKTDVSKEELPPLAYIDIMPRCIHPGNMKGKVPPEYDKFR